MSEPDFTGEVEEDFIIAQLKTLAGGRTWETQVPDDEELPRDEEGGVKPYIIIRFAEPLASPQGRNIGSGEQGQPQSLSFTVIVCGDNADAVKEVSRAHRRLLVGAIPSTRATPIKSSGGFGYSNSDAASRPTRYERATFYRVIINN
jgi:hypothetical protein